MNSDQSQDFWNNYSRFLNSTPTTEQPNPLSQNLSTLCETNIAEAFKIFNQIEQESITALSQYLPQILQFQIDVQKTLQENKRIYLIGCGASGRLSVLLQHLWSLYYPNKSEQIISVAAGGDISLIKSIEQFEDKEEFGVKQLLAQGYTDNDLVIGLSASGESPFILSALAYANKTSRYKPYLICNNPNSSIIQRNIKLEPLINSIKTINLDVGPMALTGSTRLQATTAMQIACAVAILNKDPVVTIKNCYSLVQNIDFANFAAITTAEAEVLRKKEYVLYTTNNPILGLSILADTTERSPTFNLAPFENQNNLQHDYSPFYVSLDIANNVDDSWLKLLNHSPMCLNWPDFIETTPQYLNGFDLSKNSKRATAQYLAEVQHQQLWHITSSNLSIKFADKEFNLTLPTDIFERTIVYKALLNSHSTLLMGRLGYFYANLMIALKPSNHKLMDRTIRYAIFILKTKHHLDINYKIVANALFNEMERLKSNESIVMNVVNAVMKEHK